MDDRTDAKMMERALALAEKGLGRASPNPAVGAVLALGDAILSEGYHQKAGGPHAEVEALRVAQLPIPPEATLYVTLEPCSTDGRTPPCTSAILDAGIRRVVFGSTDPTAANSNRARSILEPAGVEVVSGILEDECNHLNRAWNKWILTGRPYIFAKYAMTLDGRISTPSGRSRKISSPESHQNAMELRSQMDAILVGAETVRRDNPQLTLRPEPDRPQPHRIVVTRSGNLPTDAALLNDEHKDRTQIYKDRPLEEVMADLGKQGINSVLIEGGGTLLGEAFDLRIIDEIVAYLCPTILAGPTPAIGGVGIPGNDQRATLTRPRTVQVGPDLRIQGKVNYP